MSSEKSRQTGLFWTPRGGSNAKDIWGSCHTFSSVTGGGQNGKTKTTTIIVDLGQHEEPSQFEGGFDKVVPVLDDCLDIPGRKKAENKAQAVFLTHGHSDHMAGIAEYLLLGVRLPPLYGSEYTLNAVQKELMEKGIPKESWPEMKRVNVGDVVKTGDMSVEVFAASHSIPGSFSFKISNERASVFHSGDIKADESSYLGEGVDFSSYDRMLRGKGVDLMTFDATATDLTGHATYESEIFDAYKNEFEKNSGRQVVALLPVAHMERLASVICAAQAAGRDVVIDGGASLNSNIMALKLAGYDLQKMCPDIKVVSAHGKEAKNIDPEKSVTVSTGLYMEENSPFIRCLKGENDSFVLRQDAFVIAPMTRGRDEKLRQLLKNGGMSGIDVITGKENAKLYGSGHAQEEDFKKIARYVRPASVVPIHCSAEKAAILNRLADRSGYATLPVYLHNGMTVRVDREDGCRIVRENQPAWFGVRHTVRADGTAGAAAVKIDDCGYADASMQQRRNEAIRKIAGYRQKRALKQTSFLRQRGGHGR